MSIFEYDEEKHNKFLRQEGFEDGLAQGRELNLISLICKKLKKSKSVELIAEELEEEISVIEPICKVASDFAPAYDIHKIYQALQMQRQYP